MDPRVWDEELTHLVRALSISEDDLKPPRAAAEKIFQSLQRSRQFSIDRCGILGSVGKKTALKHHLDLDCVIYFNDLPSPESFPQLLKDVEKILLNDSSLSFKSERRGKHSLQGIVDGKYEVDIVPAINYSQNEKEQRAIVMQKMRNSMKDSYKYSSSLDENQIEFIRNQTPFVHDVIRLAKIWNRTIHIDSYISGRSSMIELIAVHVAQNQEKRNDRSLGNALRQFLLSMAKFDELNIVFEMFYSRVGVDLVIANERPLILDPSNPYNNFASRSKISASIVEQFKYFAKTTLERLQQKDIYKVFEPQPCFMSNFFEELNDLKWFVAVFEKHQKHKNLIIRKPEKISMVVIKVIQHFLEHLEIIYKDDVSKNDVKITAEEKIDSHIIGKKQSWGPSYDSIEMYDVTFEIPSRSCLLSVSISKR